MLALEPNNVEELLRRFGSLVKVSRRGNRFMYSLSSSTNTKEPASYKPKDPVTQGCDLRRVYFGAFPAIGQRAVF